MLMQYRIIDTYDGTRLSSADYRTVDGEWTLDFSMLNSELLYRGPISELPSELEWAYEAAIEHDLGGPYMDYISVRREMARPNRVLITIFDPSGWAGGQDLLVEVDEPPDRNI